MINTIHTSCKNCVFAKYSDKTQIDCYLNYIERYKEKNVTILETYDDEKEFFVINDRKCIGYKTQDWFDTIGLKNSSIEDKINKINESNKLSYLLVIDLNQSSSSDLSNIINDLNESKIKPVKIIFIKHPNSLSFQDIDQSLKNLKFNVVWTVQDMVDNFSHEQIIHIIVNTHKEYNFLCCIKKYKDNISDFIETVNNLIFNDLEIFSLAKNLQQSYYIFNTLVYRYALFVEGVDILTDDNHHVTI